MGDRCYVTVTLRRDDMPKFTKILGRNWFSDQDRIDQNTVTVFIEEANYGFQRGFANLASKGMTFMATNSSGDDYGPGATACYKGNVVTIDTNCDGIPCVRYWPNGSDEDDARLVDTYYQVVGRVKEYFRWEGRNVGAHSYDDLIPHIGHKVVCVGYGTFRVRSGRRCTENVAVECEDCGVVLMDFDRPEEESTRDPGEQAMEAQDILQEMKFDDDMAGDEEETT